MAQFTDKLLDAKKMNSKELFLTYQLALTEAIVSDDPKMFLKLSEKFAELQFGYKKSNRKTPNKSTK